MGGYLGLFCRKKNRRYFPNPTHCSALQKGEMLVAIVAPLMVANAARIQAWTKERECAAQCNVLAASWKPHLQRICRDHGRSMSPNSSLHCLRGPGD